MQKPKIFLLLLAILILGSVAVFASAGLVAGRRQQKHTENRMQDEKSQQDTEQDAKIHHAITDGENMPDDKKDDTKGMDDTQKQAQGFTDTQSETSVSSDTIIQNQGKSQQGIVAFGKSHLSNTMKKKQGGGADARQTMSSKQTMSLQQTTNADAAGSERGSAMNVEEESKHNLDANRAQDTFPDSLPATDLYKPHTPKRIHSNKTMGGSGNGISQGNIPNPEQNQGDESKHPKSPSEEVNPSKEVPKQPDDNSNPPSGNDTGNAKDGDKSAEDSTKSTDDGTKSSEPSTEVPVEDFSEYSRDFILLGSSTDARGNLKFAAGSAVLPQSSLVGLRRSGENDGKMHTIQWEGNSLSDIANGKRGEYELLARVEGECIINGSDYSNATFVVNIIVE